MAKTQKILISIAILEDNIMHILYQEETELEIEDIDEIWTVSLKIRHATKR